MQGFGVIPQWRMRDATFVVSTVLAQIFHLGNLSRLSLTLDTYPTANLIHATADRFLQLQFLQLEHSTYSRSRTYDVRDNTPPPYLPRFLRTHIPTRDKSARRRRTLALLRRQPNIANRRVLLGIVVGGALCGSRARYMAYLGPVSFFVFDHRCLQQSSSRPTTYRPNRNLARNNRNSCRCSTISLLPLYT
ncbi:hypothetical protein B0H14DRAFT_344809 [Mycena olivaceomarginata]|nr:hypothetical protein B0H14DRAFT_344809 [Mycena olivaceomarginata]